MLLYTYDLHNYVAQLVMCLDTDADPGVASSIQAESPYFVILKYFLQSFSSLPLIHSRRIAVSYKRKYVHKIFVYLLFKLAQEKVR